MPTEPVQQIDFGARGNDRNHLGDGWAGDEPGYRWAIGRSSELWLDHPGADDGFVLELDLNLFHHPPELPAQRLGVAVRDGIVGRSVVAAAGSRFYRIPPHLLAGPGPVRITLQHQDATAPSRFGGNDDRPLAFALRHLRLHRAVDDPGHIAFERGCGISPDELVRRTGMPADEFMQNFESLGDNCEFGLVQRRCGAEPLGLLRFANISLDHLKLALANEFAGLGEVANLEFWLEPGRKREYAIRDTAVHLTFHTFQYEGEVDEATLLPQHAARLKFLRRELLDDLADGEKLCVFKQNAPVTEPAIRELHAALARHGRNTLLWVAQADPSHPPGTVERLDDGLLKGYVDRFAPYHNAHDLSFEVWLEICAAAHALAGGAVVGTASAAGATPAIGS